MSGLLCKPDGKTGLFSGQVSELDFERLLVVTAHVSDAALVDVDTVLVVEASQECAKCLLDVSDYLFLLDPLGERLFCLCVVVDCSEGTTHAVIVVLGLFSVA